MKNKKALALALAVIAVICLSLTIFAGASSEKIEAYIEYGRTVLFGGVKQTMHDVNGKEVYPISYQGTTYLPVRAISEMLGVDVEWDAETQTVKLEDSRADEPETVKVPDVSGIEEEKAKTSVESKGLLPAVIYEYSDKIDRGVVIRTDLEVEAEVDCNSKITLFVSRGPSHVKAKLGTVKWENIDKENPDKWTFAAPEIKDGYLYILCRTTFGSDFTFKDRGGGSAVSGDERGFFNTEASIEILHRDLSVLDYGLSVSAGDTKDFVIKIPLDELGDDRPSLVECAINYIKDGKEAEMSVKFGIAW